MLTSRELERIDLAPRLIVANACLSALTSQRLSGERTLNRRGDAELLPSLADEFFRRGVRNYIGTAWAVSDVGAVMFAKKLYDALIPPDMADRTPGKTLGEAMQAARSELIARQNNFGALWAAYQHYGDPTQSLVSPTTRAVAAPEAYKASSTANSERRVAAKEVTRGKRRSST